MTTGDRSSVFDAAHYIIARSGGSVSQMKLHKLLYYAQAVSLVWRERVLFSASIEAWANGPVVPALWNANRYRGAISVSDLPHEGVLDATDRGSVDSTLTAFGERSGYELSELTHHEAPWLNARKDLVAGQHGQNQILPSVIRDYYRAKWLHGFGD